MSANRTMGDVKPRAKPRAFKWSPAARDLVRASLDATGAELNRLITLIAQETGNPRDACLRFARQLGLKAKRPYRTWSKREQAELEHLLELYPVRTVAMKLRRQIHQIYGMCRRLGISAKARKESLSMYALARLLHKRPQIVRRWIESGALQAENEGTANVPRHMVSQDSLRRFCKNHPELIAGDRISQERLKFIFEYVFPRPHNDLLPVRESKKERAAYAQQMSAEEREDEFKSTDVEGYEESQESL